MDKPVVIIHFQPLELYPPVMNLILFLSDSKHGKIIIYTTRYNQNNPALFAVDSSLISIRRFGFSGKGMGHLVRYMQYFKFYTACFFDLVKTGPEKILYFETLSSFPVYLYRKFIKRNVDIFVHYHEYTSPGEYAGGMKLVQYFHRKEQWLYSKLKWLSHTNEERLLNFLSDEKMVRNATSHIMPNYPGKDWIKKRINKGSRYKRMVYVGAVSRETMYFDSLIIWILKQDGYITLDIYSFNISDADARWFRQYGERYIYFHEGVDYYSLPGVLKDYDIGVVLYKGHIPNYVLNAPNKLFEYLACGLTVWVPEEMTGCKPYYTVNTYPQVIPVNFQQLDSFDWQKAVNQEGLYYHPSPWYYENVYEAIVNELYN